ncbi:MAG: DegV family EDD domain-containing protein, partial [Clostridia bacterium]|nr:DegV family EDD domain-containing protein [Clostridia bacterium]
MSKVIITCDSTCDLTQAQKDEFGIITTPLYIRINDKEYKDGIDITADALFEKIRETGELPKTAAASYQDCLDMWKPLVDQGYEIIHFSISSSMSACFQNARMAAEELGHVYPVDSASLSSGIALLA